MSALAWPLVALVALGLVWIRTRPMNAKDVARVRNLELAQGIDRPAVAAAMSRLDELGAQVAELKRRVESAEVKKLGRTG